MGLVQKLRQQVPKAEKRTSNLAKVLLLSAAVSTIPLGCAMQSAIRIDSYPVGNSQRVIDSTEEEKTGEKKFDIQTPYLNGSYKLPIRNSLNEEHFNIDHPSEIRLNRRTEVKETIYRRNPALELLAAGALGTTGLIIGAVKDSLELGLIFGGGGASLGLAGGYIIGELLDAMSPLKKEEKRDLGIETIKESLPRERNFSHNVLVYNNKPAVSTLTEISGDGRTINIRTDTNGEINLSDLIESANPNYFFRSMYFSAQRDYSRNELEKKIARIPLIQQIQPRTLDNLMNDFLRGISRKDIAINAATKELSSNPKEKVINDAKAFMMNGYELTNEYILVVVKNFVDEEINSRMKTLSFNIRDITTHVPITGSNFSTLVDVPTKNELLSRYFIGDLVEYTKKLVPDYLVGEQSFGGLDDKVDFIVYSPANVVLEVTHPNYKYVTGEIYVDKPIRKIVSMVDKGDKLRVEGETNAAGKIE